MGGGNLSKGFAISGVLYPILILVVFIIVQMLTMLGTRKMVLDKNRNQLIDSLNNNNKVYTNEELSTLLEEQKNQLTEFNNTKLDKQISKNTLRVRSEVIGDFFVDNTDLYVVIKLGNLKLDSHLMVYIRLNVFQYQYSNQYLVSTYLYNEQGFYSPRVSALQKTNLYNIYFGVDSSKQVYLVINKYSSNYTGWWIDEIATMFAAINQIDSGWNIYTTSDISNLTLTPCTYQ